MPIRILKLDSAYVAVAVHHPSIDVIRIPFFGFLLRSATLVKPSTPQQSINDHRNNSLDLVSEYRYYELKFVSYLIRVQGTLR